jgi:hypothetical protein
MKISLLSLCFIFVFTSCSIKGTNELPNNVHKLRSGRLIKVVKIVVMQYHQSEPIMMLKYETNIDLNDVSHLHEEVMDIWSEFKTKADEKKVNDVIISAYSVSKGSIVQISKCYNFTFRKIAGKQWMEIKKEIMENHGESEKMKIENP